MGNNKLSLLVCIILCANSQLSSSEIKLEEIVTTATLTKSFVKDVPSTVEVITSKEIQDSGAQSVLDILDNSGTNINVNSIPGQAINLRGYGQNHTLVLLNGRKVAGHGTVGQNNGKLIRDISVNSIERIEIIRGSAGALYGSNASAGVINIITKKSKEESATLTLSGGSYESSASLLADFGTFGENNKWSAISNIKYTRFYGKDDNYLGDEKNGWSETRGHSIYLNTDLAYAIDDNNSVNLFAEYADEEKPREKYAPKKASAGSGSGGGSGGGGSGGSGGGTGGGGGSGSTYEPYSTNHEKRHLSRYSTSLSYAGYLNDHAYNVSANVSRAYEDVFGTSITNTYTTYNLKAVDTWDLNDNNILTFGIDTSLNKVSDSDYKDDSDNTFAAFIQDEIFLLDESLYIIPALRVEKYSSFGSQIIPSISSSWEFVKNNRLKLSYGLGYRAPELIELYGELVQQNGDKLVSGNENLEAEDSKNFEARYELDLEKLDLALGYYHSKIDNLISEETTSNTCGYVTCNEYVNIDGESTIEGIEFETSYDINKYLSLNANHNYFEGKNQDNERLKNFAQNTTSAGFTLTPSKDIKASITAKYYDEYLDSKDNKFNFWSSDIFVSKTWNNKYTLALSAIDVLSSKENEQNNGFINSEINLQLTIKF